MRTSIGLPSPATVLAALALFVALGSGAYAAGLVGPADIRRDAVRAKHIAAGQVGGVELADGAVGGGDLAPGAVAGEGPFAVQPNPVDDASDPRPCEEQGQTSVFCGGWHLGANFPNPWRNYGGSLAPVEYFKDASGTVHLSGALTIDIPNNAAPSTGSRSMRADRGSAGRAVGLGAALAALILAPAAPAAVDPASWPPEGAAAKGLLGGKAPFGANGCIKANRGRAVAGTSSVYEIRLVGSAPEEVGLETQGLLEARGVTSTLSAGLTTLPRNDPAPIPILLSSERGFPFDGVTYFTCADASVDAIFVPGVDAGARLPGIARTAAHELFHAYSAGYRGLAPQANWFEEAAATWSETKVSAIEPREFEGQLQFPDVALDALEPRLHQYAMFRFLQFLEARGLLTDGASWLRVREVMDGYDSPGPTSRLASALSAQGGRLAFELAAFWGDRLKRKPMFGPQLKPAPNNSIEVVINRGVRELPVRAKPLHTKLLDLKLGDANRVEFEVTAPEDTHFWGLIEPNESIELKPGEIASFCLGGPDADDRDWPGRFPVTFTNGQREDTVEGTITITAQRDPGLCNNGFSNRACMKLIRAGAAQVTGPGKVALHTFGQDERLATWRCVYVQRLAGDGQPDQGWDRARHGIDYILNRFKQASLGQLRRETRKAMTQDGGWRFLNVGDLAGYKDGLLLMVTGRELHSITTTKELRGAVQIAEGLD